MDIYFSEDTNTHWAKFQDGDEVFITLEEDEERVKYTHWLGATPEPCTAERNKRGFPVKGTCDLCDKAQVVQKKKKQGRTKENPNFARPKYFYSITILGDVDANDYSEIEEDEDVIMTLSYTLNERFKKLLRTIGRYHDGETTGIPIKVTGTKTNRGKIKWIDLDFEEATEDELNQLKLQHKKKTLRGKKDRAKARAARDDDDDEEEEEERPKITLTKEERTILEEFDGMRISKRDFRLGIVQDFEDAEKDIADERIDEITNAVIKDGRVDLPKEEKKPKAKAKKKKGK